MDNVQEYNAYLEEKVAKLEKELEGMKAIIKGFVTTYGPHYITLEGAVKYKEE